MSTPETVSSGPKIAPARSVSYNVLIALCALTILLQGVWAGIFLEHDGERHESQSWIDVHARGAEVALALAALATVTAFIRLRHRRVLWIGSAVLTILLILESYLGGLIHDQGKDTLTAIHVPLAMALIGLAVYLPARAINSR